MPSLWEVLGYERVATDIAGVLQAGEQIAVLEGPPGVGKSWLAKDIGALWEAEGGSAVLAEGDSLKGDASFYPFAFAMGSLPSGWKSVGPALAGVARAGEALAGTAGLITATVEMLAKAHSSRRRGRTVFLGDTEQAILYELERLAKKSPLLFIADNLHWWDGKSLEILCQLRSPRMWEVFPFLAELRVLAVQTPEPYQSVANPDAHEAVISPGAATSFPLDRIERDGFEDVLVALGAEPRPTGEVTDLVHAFSGGHLALASRCAERIASGESEVFLAASSAEQFLRTLLTDRIRSLGSIGKEAIEMLQIAAVLGLTFRPDEVTCASDRDKAETIRILRYCRGEGVLEVAGGLDRFVHDLYRQHFLQLAARDKARIHEKLSDCLRRLRPADYELRCLNAIDAEQPAEAGKLGVQVALQARRDGRDWREVPEPILKAMDIAGTTAVAEGLVEALDHLNAYRFGDCVASLDRLPRRLPRPLAAEADHIRAMCLMSTRSEQDRARGRSVLEAWSGYEDEEPELGTRLMLLLLYGLFHLPDKTPAWTLERQIHRSLSARAEFDPAAEDALYTLDRCSGGLHPSDMSLVRTREAAEHFGPREGQTLLRRPVEYYRCLVNYGATLINNAMFEEAAETHQRLTALIERYRDGVFPRTDYAYMNGLLAEYRLGAVTPDEAQRRQHRIARSHRVDGDPFYVDNALAVYLALADRHDEALEIFERLHAKLMGSRAEPEPSMVYLILANRCATRYVAGDVTFARAEWPALMDVAKQSNYTDRDAVALRHELLAEPITAGVRMSAVEFDRYLAECHPDRLGPLWRNSALGFMMPAIEFWREN